jgi:hypothetical protein
MINAKRPPINYHSSHAHQHVSKVIDWMGLGWGRQDLASIMERLLPSSAARPSH